MATKAKGTLFQYADTIDASDGSWTTIGNVIKGQRPENKADPIEVTEIDSDAKERVPGLPDVGPFKVTTHYVKAAAATLHGLFGTEKAFRVKYPDNSGWKCMGFISMHGEEEAVNGDVLRATLEVTATAEIAPFGNS